MGLADGIIIKGQRQKSKCILKIQLIRTPPPCGKAAKFLPYDTLPWCIFTSLVKICQIFVMCRMDVKYARVQTVGTCWPMPGL